MSWFNYLVIFSAILFSAESAHADGAGPYVSLGGTGTFLQDSDYKFLNLSFPDSVTYKDGYGYSFYAGYDFGEIRTDLEYTYRHNEIKRIVNVPGDGADTTTDAYMVNLYYDIPTSIFVKPYLGIGAGFATMQSTGLEHKNEFAGQLSGGFDFCLSDNISIYTQYKYFTLARRDDYDEGGGAMESIKYRTNNVEAGLRFKF